MARLLASLPTSTSTTTRPSNAPPFRWDLPPWWQNPFIAAVDPSSTQNYNYISTMDTASALVPSSVSALLLSINNATAPPPLSGAPLNHEEEAAAAGTAKCRRKNGGRNSLVSAHADAAVYPEEESVIAHDWRDWDCITVHGNEDRMGVTRMTS